MTALGVRLVGEGVEMRRWFLNGWTERGETYVLSKIRGLDTEPTLQALVDAFPEAGVSLRRDAD